MTLRDDLRAAKERSDSLPAWARPTVTRPIRSAEKLGINYTEDNDMTETTAPKTADQRRKEAVNRLREELLQQVAQAAQKVEPKPTPVEIVRPKLDGPTVFSELAVNILGLLLAGKSVQTWAAKLFGKELTYWEAVRLVSVFRAVQKADTHRLWTRESKR